MATPPISKFFKKSDNTLPDAESPAERSANKCVQNELSLSTPSRKRKRGEYGEYSPETRYKIARYAIENGNSRAARHFSSVLDKNINESTVRGFKVAFNRRRNLDKDFEQSQLVSLPRSPRGRPTKLGKYDEFVQSYVRKLRKTGGIVNSRIIISAAKGFLIAKDRTLLAENGGPITLSKAWAVSLMKRMGLVKRKGTKGVKHLPDDFSSIKSEYVQRVDSVVKQHNIPDSLIINWDQTGSNYVPVNPWTMEEKGSKQVPIAQLDDKRQMTVLLACNKAGEMLPPQLIYQGKTDLCHPSYTFPEGWDVTHTDNHWSTSVSMMRYD